MARLIRRVVRTGGLAILKCCSAIGCGCRRISIDSDPQLTGRLPAGTPLPFWPDLARRRIAVFSGAIGWLAATMIDSSSYWPSAAAMIEIVADATGNLKAPCRSACCSRPISYSTSKRMQMDRRILAGGWRSARFCADCDHRWTHHTQLHA